MDQYLGSVSIFAFNYAPQGWAFCQGQTLSISQNAALYALLGTFYGGNGTTNFALPDLRGRVVIGMGAGPGQPTYQIGQTGGANAVTLTVQNLAPHAHTGTVAVSDSTRSLAPPATGNILQALNTLPASTTGTVALGGVTTQSTGGGQPISILPPFLALNFCIALQGVFPPRQ